MENQTLLSQQLITPNLVSTVQQLSTSLKTIQPLGSDQSMTQLITYTLIATALVGIMVYHYIKSQEQTN